MANLIQLQGICKSFRASDGAARSVLDGVNFTLGEGEIVALLGKSGSGKSTLLRIIAGLLAAEQGQAQYRERPIHGPQAGIAMVFQSFALFPWLTVQQNVELGLEAQGIAPAQRAARAGAMLELIGLSGFGGALPRELSGGMRQRVGIARALATEPDVLLMDEAFSALDVLTGETLRNDILDLWQRRAIPTKGILIVSHNIEEAVMMADRIIILSSDPGRIRTEVPVALARPRDPDSPQVRALIDEVYGLMTQRPVPLAATSAATPHVLDYRLPHTNIARLEGVLELLAGPPFHGRADLPQLAEEAELPDEDLFPTYEALGMLGLVTVEGGDITLTALGRHYAQGEKTLRQELFGQQLLTHVPLVAHIRALLERESSGSLPAARVLRLLEDGMEHEAAQRSFDTAVEWARYGEAFEFDYHTGRVSLPVDD